MLFEERPKTGKILQARLVAVAKDLCSEGLELRPSLPGVQRQTGFLASLLKEGDAIPSMFDRHLWQQ